MPISSFQDVVKGVDFTALSPQTAAEHNQLVDLATPYAESSSVGVGFILTTTDSASNTPDVPDPTAGGDYNKWARYMWNRRPFTGESDKSCKLYSWNDDATSDATYLKWQLSDPASNTTIGGGAGTPLQTAIDTINTNANNAVADASSASSTATDLANAIYGGVGSIPSSGTDLSTQVSNNATDIATNLTSIGNINTAISGNVANVTDSGGINGKLVDLQNQITDGFAGVTAVSNLTPGSVAGSLIRTSQDGSTVEWFDPTNTSNEIFVAYSTSTGTVIPAGATTAIATTPSISLPPGTYLVDITACGNYSNGSSGTANSVRLDAVFGATTITGLSAYSAGTSSPNTSGTIKCVGVVTITTAMGSTALTLNGVGDTHGTLSSAGGTWLAVVIRKISAKAA